MAKPKTFTTMALPMAWGPWMEIQSHVSSIGFKIAYEAIGDTMVMGKVRYYKSPNAKVEQEFKDEVTILTANVIATIEVCFKGIPLGSAVQGTIE